MCVGEPKERVWDKDVINKNKAENAKERRKVFDKAVNRTWINKDIGAIRRIETGDRYCYAMWDYPAPVERPQETTDNS